MKESKSLQSNSIHFEMLKHGGEIKAIQGSWLMKYTHPKQERFKVAFKALLIKE